MSSDFAIRASGVSKNYTLYERPFDRLKQLLRLGSSTPPRQFAALKDVHFEVGHGEVVGIIGRNGAGKSTLLQLICGTLEPSIGQIEVNGRVAALLELGAGFNPEFTGRENVFFNGAVLGLSQQEIASRLDDIIAFADIGAFIDQPVKTYSSGMFVRLAFSVAVNVEPDILIIDEALAVGDGQFARKSFERIMKLKDAGKTILFCSHSMYQVEALCSRVLWLEGGEMRAFCPAPDAIRAYTAFLDAAAVPAQANVVAKDSVTLDDSPQPSATLSRITSVRATVDGLESAVAQSGRSRVVLEIDFVAVAGNTVPSLAIAISTLDGRCIASTSTVNDGVALRVDATGQCKARCVFEQLPLLRGEYSVSAWLLCDRALFVHESVEAVCRIKVDQSGLEQGLVSLPHRWECLS